MPPVRERLTAIWHGKGWFKPIQTITEFASLSELRTKWTCQTRGSVRLRHLRQPLQAILRIESLSTDRFLLDHWRPQIRDPNARRRLELSLAAILKPPVLAHLPPSFRLAPEDGAVSAWITARDAESDVLTVRAKEDGRLIGLVLLAKGSDTEDEVVHVGYLLAERAWGQGAASEILEGIVSFLRAFAPIRLVGGVDPDNPASARVLQKTGFSRDPVLSMRGGDIYSLDIE